ncbi:MAG: Abi-alpha family protein [Fusobacterium sp.]
MAEEEIIEGSKAIQEGSKFGVKVLESGEKLGKFITKVTGLTDDGILGLINDKLQFLRWERQYRMADEYNIKFKNQMMKPISPKFLVPILENGSLEDDDSLQDIWINLLGSFTNKNYKDERRMAYIDIIKSLNSLDANILKEIYEINLVKNNKEIINITKNNLSEKIRNENSKESIDLSVDNLYRVLCIREAAVLTDESGEVFCLSKLGEKFVEACICNNKGGDNYI